MAALSSRQALVVARHARPRGRAAPRRRAPAAEAAATPEAEVRRAQADGPPEAPPAAAANAASRAKPLADGYEPSKRVEDYIIEPILNLSISEEHLGADAVAGMLSRLVRVWQVRGGAAEAQLCAQNTPTGCACVCVMSPTQRARGVGAVWQSIVTGGAPKSAAPGRLRRRRALRRSPERRAAGSAREGDDGSIS